MDIPDSSPSDLQTDMSETWNTESKSHRIIWLGAGSEYFRIWIVNTALTILTLGFYWPWARIRSRRYFYSHTELSGQSFEYLAKPIPILIGYLIVLLGLAIYNGSQFIHPALVGVVLLLFYCVWPWLYWKAIRFRFHNSSYLGIRFQFKGTLKESYQINFLWSLLIILTGGLIFPFIEYKRKNYVFNHLYFGQTPFRFKAEVGKFYLIYLIAYAVIFAVYMVLIGVIFIAAMGFGFATNTPSGEGAMNSEALGVVLVVFGGIAYFLLLLILTGVQVYLSTQILNYCLNQLRLENGIRIESHIKFWEMLKIRISNLLLIIVTLGIYTPWAAVRKHRYIVGCMAVHVPEQALDRVAGNRAQENVAIGDASAEFFDFDIGF